MGGRGASSSATSKNGVKTLEGKQVLDTATGYDIWNIGANAPKGYVGLIKGSGVNAKTAYIKSQYADEFNSNLAVGRINMNASARVLNSSMNRARTNLENLKNGKRDVKGNKDIAIKRAEKLFKAYEVTMKLRRDIYKY